MGELELVGLHEDGEHLVLVGPDGQRFRVRIDEQLRAAVRRDRPALEQLRAHEASALSPREIQAQIRSGRTAEDIAAEAGLDVEHVRRYEGPVLAEREFIVEQARATRVGREPDAPQLGDLVTDRLATRHVDPADLSWDACREPGRPWRVTARFVVGDAPRQARWTFDPGARTLQADEDEARWLSETPIEQGPAPHRHLAAVRGAVFDVEADGAVRPVLAAVDVRPDAGPTAEDPTASLLDDLRLRRGVRQALEPEADDDTFEGFGPQRTFDLGGLDLGAPGAHPVDADPTREAVVLDPGPDHDGSPRADSAPAAHGTELPARDHSRARRSRPKVPSWDEIVFGAKPE